MVDSRIKELREDMRQAFSAIKGNPLDLNLMMEMVAVQANLLESICEHLECSPVSPPIASNPENLKTE